MKNQCLRHQVGKIQGLKHFKLRRDISSFKRYNYKAKRDHGHLETLSELKTLEWWISGLMLNPNFFLISRLNMACSPHEFNLQKSQQIGIKDITFSFQLRPN